MNDTRDFLFGRIRNDGGDSHQKHADATVYTGAYDNVVVTRGDSEEPHLSVYVDKKGKPVAVTFGGRILPFVPIETSEAQLVQFRSNYRKGLAGVISKLYLRVPRG